MVDREEVGRIAVVLVRARNPNNIGAVARAMHDFGFSDLRIVNEFAMPLEGARSAVNASSVIEAVRSYGSVAEAVEDCTLVVGTTAVGERDLAHRLYALNDAGMLMRSAVAGRAVRVALVFGSEKTGLSNQELSHCHWLVTIPMAQQADGRHLSMNLGQAVAVCLYEMVRGRPPARTADAAEAATAGEIERLMGLLNEVLQESEYRKHHPANSDVEDVRRLVVRMGLSRKDAPVWMGMLRQVLWKLRGQVS